MFIRVTHSRLSERKRVDSYWSLAVLFDQWIIVFISYS